MDCGCGQGLPGGFICWSYGCSFFFFMLGDSSPFEPEVQKEGTLQKLGGGAGGHKNWKDRYLVLTDHLYYYGSKAEYTKDPKAPLGRINLLSYYVAPSDPDTHEFCVHSYPKVRT